jgi:hypothetical protein
VVGITNALNVVADGLAAGPAGPDLLSPVDEETPDEALGALFAEIRDFSACRAVPPVFRVMARDPGYAREVWGAVRRAFSDQRLPRRFKEALAFAVSLTTRSGAGLAGATTPPSEGLAGDFPAAEAEVARVPAADVAAPHADDRGSAGRDPGSAPGGAGVGRGTRSRAEQTEDRAEHGHGALPSRRYTAACRTGMRGSTCSGRATCSMHRKQ